MAAAWVWQTHGATSGTALAAMGRAGSVTDAEQAKLLLCAIITLVVIFAVLVTDEEQ